MAEKNHGSHVRTYPLKNCYISRGLSQPVFFAKSVTDKFIQLILSSKLILREQSFN